ncbi:PaaI family thioesterase [Frankia gtarii]|uniref:PaaI family thioesterase n=1 Tax=Frankia gtarii TaxID=2950102 RepID=UPI0021C01F34|nr:PaaI family thioesterase [Frankia gtarii]
MTETGTSPTAGSSSTAGASADGLVPAARTEPAGHTPPAPNAPVGASPPAREYAESRFRLSQVIRGERGVRVTMELGPWLDGPGGTATIGSLGVLVDSAIGMEVYESRPENSHSVTAELSLDVIGAPPWSGGLLTASAELLGRDPAGGTARCEVRDDAGRLVAVGIGRCRFVSIPGTAAGYLDGEPQMLPPAAHHSLLEALSRADAGGPGGGGVIAGPVRDGDVGRFLLPANPAFENGGGTVHGGILFCAAELATEALADPAVPERTTAIRVNYLRPAALTAEVTATAELVHRGRTVSLYRVTTAGPSGKPATLSTITRERGTPVF